MKTLLSIFIVIISITVATAQSTYYVATSGSNSNDGTTPSKAWRTITYAASSSSPVSPGDKVYIKAGNYGSEKVVFAKDGTAAKPITFEGYQSTPGDNPDLGWQYGDGLNSAVMPLLDGGNRNTGTALLMSRRKYVHLKNLQIRNYAVGIKGWNAHHNKFYNIIAMELGNKTDSYSGQGISLGSLASNNTVENCVVYNACAEGIAITGDGHIIKNCRVYADDNSTGKYSAMDYYINIGGNNNVVEGCYVERVGNIGHTGHGISLKGNCQNNMIRNCVSKGMASQGYQLRHRGVKNNTLENCTAINSGFTIRDGASYNTIKNCTTIDAPFAILFMDTSEDGGAQYAGRYNVFENCIFKNTSNSVIDFDKFRKDMKSVCDKNTFMNCVFDGGAYLFNADRENRDNKMVNCIVVNVQNYSHSTLETGGYPINFDFEYSNFWNNGFATPAGTSISTFDPQFVNIASNDYHLTAASACIDLGTSNGAPAKDFDGIDRPQGSGIDLGPYEFSSSSSNCMTDLNLSETIASGTYRAAATITATGTINAGSTIVFDTKERISLRPGFTVQNGAVFNAKIGNGCTPGRSFEAGNTTISSTLTAEHGIKVYPNPTSGMIYIEGISNNDVISLYDLNGKLLLKKTAATARAQVDISSLPGGLYIVKVGDKTSRRIAIAK